MVAGSVVLSDVSTCVVVMTNVDVVAAVGGMVVARADGVVLLVNVVVAGPVVMLPEEKNKKIIMIKLHIFFEKKGSSYL